MNTHAWVFRTALATAILLPISLRSGETPRGESATQPANGCDFELAYRRIRDAMAKEVAPELAVLLEAAQAARRAEELGDAERFLTEAARRAPTDCAAVDFQRLLLRAQLGHATEMRPKLAGRLAAGHPDAELAWEALGRGYLRVYRLPEAKECFTELIRIRPDSLPGLLGRAETLRQWPQLPWGPIPAGQAVPDLQRAVALAPWHVTARLRLAEGLAETDFDKSQLREAEAHLRAVLKERPADPEGRTLLAQVLEKLGRSDEANRLLIAVVNDCPKYVPALRSLVMQTNVSDKAASFRWACQALEADPYDRTSLYRTALHRLRFAEQKDEAKTLLDRFRDVADAEREIEELKQRMTGNLIYSDRNDPNLRYETGRRALRLGRRDEARLWFERTVIENPDHEPAQSALRALQQTANPN